MVPDPGAARLDLLGTTIPAGFDTDVVVLAAGCELSSGMPEWRAALVEVEDGEVELVRPSGEVGRFGPGDLLVLLDGRLRAVPERAAVVVGVWRTGGLRPGRDEKSGGCRLNVHDDTAGRPDLHPEG